MSKQEIDTWHFLHNETFCYFGYDCHTSWRYFQTTKIEVFCKLLILLEEKRPKGSYSSYMMKSTFISMSKQIICWNRHSMIHGHSRCNLFEVNAYLMFCNTTNVYLRWNCDIENKLHCVIVNKTIFLSCIHVYFKICRIDFSTSLKEI